MHDDNSVQCKKVPVSADYKTEIWRGGDVHFGVGRRVYLIMVLWCCARNACLLTICRDGSGDLLYIAHGQWKLQCVKIPGSGKWTCSRERKKSWQDSGSAKEEAVKCFNIQHGDHTGIEKRSIVIIAIESSWKTTIRATQRVLVSIVTRPPLSKTLLWVRGCASAPTAPLWSVTTRARQQEDENDYSISLHR